MSRAPQPGWIAAAVFAALATFVIAEPSPPFTGVITGDQVNIRSGPHINYYRTMRLDEGTIIRVVDVTQAGEITWYHIEPPAGAFSNIHGDYVRRAERGATGIVTGDRVRVRAPSPAGPDVSKSYKVQAYLNRNDTVRLLGENGPWLQIVPPKGVVLFVTSEFVKKATADDIAAARARAAAQATADASEESAARTPAADPIRTVAMEPAETEPRIRLNPITEPDGSEATTTQTPLESETETDAAAEPATTATTEPTEVAMDTPTPEADAAASETETDVTAADPIETTPDPTESKALETPEADPAPAETAVDTTAPEDVREVPVEADDPAPAEAGVEPETIVTPEPDQIVMADPTAEQRTIRTRVVVEKGGPVVITESVEPAPAPTADAPEAPGADREPAEAANAPDAPIAVATADGPDAPTAPETSAAQDAADEAAADVDSDVEVESENEAEATDPAAEKLDKKTRAALLAARNQVAQSNQRIADLESELSQTRTALQARREAARNAVEATRHRNYDAVGTLVASSIYTGEKLPLLYRVVDPQTKITTAYLRPSQKVNLNAMLGRLVGVKGVRHYDRGLKLNIIAIDSADLLVAAEPDSP